MFLQWLLSGMPPSPPLPPAKARSGDSFDCHDLFFLGDGGGRVCVVTGI